MQAFTGNQQNGLTSLFETLGGSSGGLESKASDSGMDPNLIQAAMGLFGGGSGGSGSGFDIGSLLSVAQGLTQGGGVNGFLKLIGGGEGGSNKILGKVFGHFLPFLSIES